MSIVYKFNVEIKRTQRAFLFSDLKREINKKNQV